MTNIARVTDHNFDPEVIKCDVPVLACFQADWSAPGRQAVATLTEIAGEYPDRLKVALLDIDANSTVTSAYAVLKIPTIIIFKHGQIMGRLDDHFSKETIVSQVAPFLDE